MDYDFFKKYCTITPGFRTVEIRIFADEQVTLQISDYLETRLECLLQGEIIMNLINKKDVIILIPMKDVAVQELFVEVGRLVFAGSVA